MVPGRFDPWTFRSRTFRSIYGRFDPCFINMLSRYKNKLETCSFSRIKVFNVREAFWFVLTNNIKLELKLFITCRSTLSCRDGEHRILVKTTSRQTLLKRYLKQNRQNTEIMLHLVLNCCATQMNKLFYQTILSDLF